MRFFVDSNFQTISSGKEILEERAQDTQGNVAQTAPSAYYLKGPFMECNVVNGNGRYYPFQNVSNEVDRFIREDIAQNRAVGECDHPAKPEVNLDKIAIKIEELTLNENYQYLGKARVLNSPMGKLIQTFIDDDLQIGVSTRALGSLKESNGYKEVQKDFKLIAIDAVHGPSAPNSYVQGIMENQEYFIENGIIKSEQELKEQRKKIEKAARKKQRMKEEAYAEIFKRFMDNFK